MLRRGGIILCSCVVTTLSAATWTYPDINCSLAVPDDWQNVIPQSEEIRLSVESSDGGYAVTLRVEPAPPGMRYVTEAFIEHVKQTMVARRAAVVASHWLEVEGLTAADVVFRPGEIQEAPTIGWARFIIGGALLYQITVFRPPGEPDSEAMAQSIINGFRFLQAPQPPPRNYKTRQLGFRIGYALGPFFWLAFFGGGLTVITYFALRPKKPRRRRRHQ